MLPGQANGVDVRREGSGVSISFITIQPSSFFVKLIFVFSIRSFSSFLTRTSPDISGMATKGSKSGKKEDASLTLDAITALLEQHRQALATEFKTSFSSIDSKLDHTQLTVEDHGQRVSSLELAAGDFSQRVADLENSCSFLRDENARLKAKVTDLESRSRRQNLHILGLPESTGRPTEFFSMLLHEVFGNETLPSPPEIDRAHCSLAPKPAPGQRPRPVILRLHRYQTKDLLIREARREEGNLSIVVMQFGLWRTTAQKYLISEGSPRTRWLNFINSV